MILKRKQFGEIADKYKDNLPNKLFRRHKRALVEEAIKAEEEGADKDEIRKRLINKSDEFKKESLDEMPTSGAISFGALGLSGGFRHAMNHNKKILPSLLDAGIGAASGAGLGYLAGRVSKHFNGKEDSRYNRRMDKNRDEYIDEILSHKKDRE